MLIFAIVSVSSIFLALVIAGVVTAERKATKGWDKTVKAHTNRWMDARAVQNDREMAFAKGRQFGI